MRIQRLEALTRKEKIELIQLLEEKARREKYRFVDQLFPDDGELSWKNYPKHYEFFELSKSRREICFLAGNRVGKSISGGFAAQCHATGNYPHWWPGRKFTRPTVAVVAGDTLDTTRDILQYKLFGGAPDTDDWGSGLIPRDKLGAYTRHSGKSGMVSEVKVKHEDGWSTIRLRSYDQGRKTFQGTELDFVWLDEEVPEDVYEEALMRTMTTQGLVMVTFTPLDGLTPLVMQFLPGGDPNKAGQNDTGKAVVMAGWDDAPHLTEQDKSELLASLPPHQRDARSKGIPSLGSGAIYPVPESEFVIPPFDIPAYWPRAYALDVGWNRTAAIWGAWDREADIVYLYSEHYRGQAEPPVHASAVQARGKWIPGVIDPASRGRSQVDGQQLYQQYIELGLRLTPAQNAVESGIYNVWQRLSTGRLKCFNTLGNFLSEYRIYRRDKNGKIVKDNDHLCDCVRYLCNSGLNIATVKPVKKHYTAAGAINADAIAGY